MLMVRKQVKTIAVPVIEARPTIDSSVLKVGYTKRMRRKGSPMIRKGLVGYLKVRMTTMAMQTTICVIVLSAFTTRELL